MVTDRNNCVALRFGTEAQLRALVACLLGAAISLDPIWRCHAALTPS
jgi:hypothetical protein